jgi:hypothetical protein
VATLGNCPNNLPTLKELGHTWPNRSQEMSRQYEFEFDDRYVWD